VAVFGVLRDVAGRRQPQEQVLDQLLLMPVERRIGAFGRLRDRVRDAARGLIAGQGQGRTSSPLPRLQQGVGQQRQHTGLSSAVGHHGGQQRGLHGGARQRGGPGDRGVHLAGVHRADQELAVTEQFGEDRVLHAVRVEIRSHSQDHPGTAVGVPCHPHQCLDEPGSFTLVLADGEDLLELVHDDQYVPGAVRNRRELAGNRGDRRRAFPKRMRAGRAQNMPRCGFRVGGVPSSQ
jgi:hypothetical protein